MRARERNRPGRGPGAREENKDLRNVLLSIDQTRPRELRALVTPEACRPRSSVRRPVRRSVAPMMDWTDRHCRSFHRMLSASAWLYTEMVTAQAILHGDCERLLG